MSAAASSAGPAPPAGAPQEGRGIQEVTVSLRTKKVPVDQLLRHVVEGAADCLGADEASLMLADREEFRVAVATEGGVGTVSRLAETRPAR